MIKLERNLRLISLVDF